MKTRRYLLNLMLFATLSSCSNPIGEDVSKYKEVELDHEEAKNIMNPYHHSIVDKFHFLKKTYLINEPEASTIDYEIPITYMPKEDRKQADAGYYLFNDYEEIKEYFPGETCYLYEKKVATVFTYIENQKNCEEYYNEVFEKFNVLWLNIDLTSNSRLEGLHPDYQDFPYQANYIEGKLQIYHNISYFSKNFDLVIPKTCVINSMEIDHSIAWMIYIDKSIEINEIEDYVHYETIGYQNNHDYEENQFRYETLSQEGIFEEKMKDVKKTPFYNLKQG